MVDLKGMMENVDPEEVLKYSHTPVCSVTHSVILRKQHNKGLRASQGEPEREQI